MKPLFAHLSLVLAVFIGSSFIYPAPPVTPASSVETVASFNENNCNSYFNGDVITRTLNDGYSTVGHSIWLSRSSQRVNAKYFAHKQYGTVVHDRYDTWRQGKNVVLISSGAYATGWDGKDVPAGITVDAGKVVNRSYENTMDGLVIVYATGGIVVSNIENRDLTLKKGGKSFVVDVTTASGRAEFLSWAQSEGATVFQTHLLAYKNNLLFTRATSESARRKFLVLTKDPSGNLYHVIFYMKNKSYTLYDAAQGILQYLNNGRYEVIGMINLDTGGFDIISTGSDVRDCQGDYITGTANDDRPNMTNMLAYWYN
ncbi:MAG: hypothetical protein AAGH79_19245 [Bacteroidota bacterium]